MEFELGQTYSGYHFLEVTGRSPNAIAYRVRNVLAGRDEALRVLPAFAREDRDAADAFLGEARIMARVSHPHIVAFYTAQPIEGRMAITTEWSGFVTLASRLGAGPLPMRDALDGALRLLSALACLHERNIVHLDITPDNILCSPAGEWKLANFAM